MGRKDAHRLHSESHDQLFYSGWQPVNIGSVLDLTLFSIFMNYLGDRIESTLTKFADDTLEGRAILQRPGQAGRAD